MLKTYSDFVSEYGSQYRFDKGVETVYIAAMENTGV